MRTEIGTERSALWQAESVPWRFLRTQLHQVWPVAFVVIVLYGLWLGIFLGSGHDIRDTILIGRRFITSSHASSVIRVDPTYKGYLDNPGYDGQFFYYIAIDPVNARYYFSQPAYRYTRILYPLLARGLALGNPLLVPYTLVAINLLALLGGTAILAAWLKRKGISPWYALIFGLYPGLFAGLERDLAEPLAYALIATGVYLFDFGGRRRVVWSGLIFALAALTRETTAVFPIAYGLGLLLPGAHVREWRTSVAANWRSATLLLTFALVPFALFKAFLFTWLGSTGTPTELLPVAIPFQGLFTQWPWHADQFEEIISVVAPSLICLGLAVWALWKRVWSIESTALLANIVLFVVLLNATSYVEFYASGRIAVGVVLAAIFCVPLFDRITSKNRLWLWSCAGLWLWLLAPWLLVPIASGGWHALRHIASLIAHV